MTTRILLLSTLLLVTTATTAHAEELWLVLPLQARGVDAHLADVTTDLLVQDLRARGRQARRAPVDSCDDTACARLALEQLGAQRAVHGTLTSLGERILLNVTVTAPDGRSIDQQRFSVDRPEELDLASSRIVEALVTGRPVGTTARLGSVTTEEARPDTRREAWRGTSLRLHSVHPLGSSMADAGPGLGIDIGYAFEGRHFALEPRIGARWRPSLDDERTGGFLEGVLDLGALWIPGTGNVTPFLGGGAGLRWLRTPWLDSRTLGTILVTEQQERVTDHGFGIGLHTRAGLLLLRTYAFRMSGHAEWSVAFIEARNRSAQHTLSLGVAAHF
ncbi:MAG: hypothetical protein EA398_06460 [Deltaproteobacteria bacterium]|nr:MAG: hypothetical protein EA398_06460 [Deltaproteobacteria bacterium]